MPYYINYYSHLRNSVDKPIEQIIEADANKIVTKIKQTCTMGDNNNHEKIITQSNNAFAKLKAYYYDHVDEFEYTTFQIPKHSGGMRTIHAPNDSLKKTQVMLDKLLRKSCRLLPHNAVHSYLPQRNTKTAMQVHQKNHSKWFLKIDIKDYFDNCTSNKVLGALAKYYQMQHLMQRVAFKQIVKYIAFLDDKLPQGSPASPVLSNLYLIDFDYALTEYLKSRTDGHFRYTRYADDILISADISFNFQEIVLWISDMLLIQYGLEVKKEKTRYGSFNGRNWNLGLMYNNTYDITVGYKNKHLIKNRIHNLFRDEPKDKDSSEYGVWRSCKLQLVGLLSYYKFIEPAYFTDLIAKYKAKGYDI